MRLTDELEALLADAAVVAEAKLLPELTEMDKVALAWVAGCQIGVEVDGDRVTFYTKQRAEFVKNNGHTQAVLGCVVNKNKNTPDLGNYINAKLFVPEDDTSTDTDF